MLVDIALQPYCEGCPMMELETHSLFCTENTIITHICEHHKVCENAVNQYKQFLDKRKEESK